MSYLENDILKLRAPEPSDIDLLYVWENDPEIWFCGNTIAPYSRFILSKYLETAHLDIFEAKQLRLMINLKNKSNKSIGTIDLFDFDPYHNRAGIGILIADKTERRKGYASMSLELMIKYCFDFLGLNQLFCNIDTENKESLELFVSHGFEMVGIKKKWNKRGVDYFDECFLQLINKKNHQ